MLVHILKDSNHEQAAALELLVKRANSSTREQGEGSRGSQGGGASDHDIERAMIQALEPLQNMPNFNELVSTTNDCNQTLAHFAVMFGYPKLLRQLVEWEIDLTTTDVNGLTALHCAYRRGEKAIIELLLNAGAPENVLDALGRTPAHLMPNEFEASEIALDALGRAPSHSMPEAFDSSGDYDANMAWKIKSKHSEENLDALFLYQKDSADDKFVDDAADMAWKIKSEYLEKLKDSADDRFVDDDADTAWKIKSEYLEEKLDALFLYQEDSADEKFVDDADMAWKIKSEYLEKLKDSDDEKFVDDDECVQFGGPAAVEETPSAELPTTHSTDTPDTKDTKDTKEDAWLDLIPVSTLPR